MTKSDSLPGLRRGTSILEQLSLASDGMTFGDIAQLLHGVPSSTISRLLKVMIEENLIGKEPGSRYYQLRPRAVRLGRMLCGGGTKRDVLQPVVDRLAQQTGESAAYYEFQDDHFAIVVKSETADSFHYLIPGELNRRFDRNTFGKVCLSYQSREAVDRSLAGLDSIDLSSFRDLLDDWHGKAVIIDEHRISRRRQNVVTRVVAPVFAGEFCGAMGITGIGTFDEEFRRQAADAVMTAAQTAGKNFSGINQSPKETQ